MTDLIAEGLRAVATRSPLAVPLVFAAGVLTSAGPCIAPRYVAVTALAHAARRPWAFVAAFAGGLIGGYAVLALVAGAVGALWLRSAPIYGALSIALIAAGLIGLARGHRHRCHAGGRSAASGVTRGAGGAFLLGASSALVVSPCCAPVIAAIAGLTIAGTRVEEGVALVMAFACGHALPLFGAAAAGRKISALVARAGASHAPALVSATLMLALGAYYGVLA